MGKATLYSEEMIADYTAKGYWDATTFAEIWDKNALRYPDKEAVADQRSRLTWAEAKQWIDRLALGLLELGFTKDQTIILHLPNWVELLLFRIACEKAGVICVPVPWTFRHREIVYIASKIEAVGIVIPWRFHNFDYAHMASDIRSQLPTLKHIFVAEDPVPEGTLSVKALAERPIEEQYPHDSLEKTRFSALEFSWVQLTGGTTGFPKFVEAPICGRVYSARAFVAASRMTGADVCGMFTTGPVGPNVFASICAPLVAAKIVMLERFEAEDALKLIERERISMVGLVPTMLEKMLHHPDFARYDLSSLRLLMPSGAPLPPSLAIEADQKGLPILQYLGGVDFGAITAPFVDSPRKARLFTVNRPVPGNEIRLLDETGSEVAPGKEGEIVIRGPVCNSGFYKDPEATWEVWTRDGWFHTGDLGKFDDAGNLIVVGRIKDIIIRGGQNIFPGEVEDILLQHPKIAAVALVGMPDPVMGEKACAYVVPNQGQALGFEEMVDFLKERSIASYKLPERLEIVDQLPLVVSSGKVDKKVLARDVGEKLKAEGKA